MDETTRSSTKAPKTALITGGSRGIGAATTIALADRGYDVAITYRNKAARANNIVSQAMQRGVCSLAEACDITHASDLAQFFAALRSWTPQLDILVLNASGGLEREALAADPDYPMHINCDAQLALVDASLPLIASGGVIVFVTSHWAHLYDQGIQQIPAYAPVAESKHAGEQALRARIPELSAQNIRLLIVTGDLIADTITPKLLERSSPGLAAIRLATTGPLPTATEMGKAIATAATNSSLSTGHTIVIGAPLASLLPS